MGFYKLYFKNEYGAYENAEIYQDMKQVIKRISKDSRGYLIIHRHDNRDEIVEMKQATIKPVDNIKSNVEVKAKVSLVISYCSAESTGITAHLTSLFILSRIILAALRLVIFVVFLNICPRVP